MRRTNNWIRLATLGACAASLVLAGRLSADQGEGSKSFEKNLDAGLYEVILHGVTIFNNQGDHAGCYRLFEGALQTVKPVLTNYPELQKKIDAGLRNAAQQPRVADRAHALRKVLDEVRHTINPQSAVVAKTLWDRLGGEAGVNKVLGDVFASAANDPAVDFTRGGKYPLTPDKAAALQKSVLDFVSSATGGPFKYTGASMKDAHAGMGITNEQFNAFAGHLKGALEKNGVAPADVEAVMGAAGSTRKDIVEAAPKKLEIDQPDKKKQTLWDRLGGEKGVNKVLDDLFASAAADPKVDFTRGGKYPLTPDKAAALHKSVFDFVSSATGGPNSYTGASMKAAHQGMGVTNEQFNAFAGHLKTALEKNGVPPADVTAVLGAVGSTRADIVEPAPKKDDKN